MKKVSDIYDIVNFRRNKAKDGFIRPTLKQLFKPDLSFEELIAGFKGEAGTSKVFNNRNSYTTSVTSLTDKKAVVLYCGSDYVEVCVLSVNSSGTITVGQSKLLDSSYCGYAAAITLSETKVLVVCPSNGYSTHGMTRVLDIEGTEITLGSNILFTQDEMGYISLDTISETKALLVYTRTDDSYKATARVLTVTGQSVTTGPALVFDSEFTSKNKVTVLSETKAVVVYEDYHDNHEEKLQILTISGTTVNLGGRYPLSNNVTLYPMVKAISDTHLLIAYRDNTSEDAVVCVYNIINNSLTRESEFIVPCFGNFVYPESAILSNTMAVMAYMTPDVETDAFVGEAIVLTINGSEITFGDPIRFNDSRVDNVSITALSDKKALITYKSGLNNFATACVIH